MGVPKAIEESCVEFPLFQPNARHELPPEAEVRYERTLEAVSSCPWLGGRRARRYFSIPRFLNDSSITLSTFLRIWSMLKLAGRWLGGYSLNVSRKAAA